MFKTAGAKSRNIEITRGVMIVKSANGGENRPLMGRKPTLTRGENRP